MASEKLSEDMIKCKIWANEYGSDHRATHTAILMGQILKQPQQERYLLQKANWKAIRETIKQTLAISPFPTVDIEEM